MRIARVLGFAALGAVAAFGFAVLTIAQQPLPESLVNAGFEEPGTPPPGWSLEEAAAEKGRIETRAGVPGATGLALALIPNARNTGGDKPLGLGQMVSAVPLRGQRVTLRARLGGSGGAVAVLGFALVDGSGAVIGAPLTLRGADGPPLALQSLPLDEPVPASAQSAILFVTAEGTEGTAFADDIALVAEAPPAASPPGTPFRASVSLRLDRDLGPVRRGLFGTNVEWIRNAQGLWNPATDSLDEEMIGLARAAGVSVLRFPGGGWSDAYDWRNGIGPRAQRPKAPHAPGEPELSENVVGTDEMIEAARRIGADLLITLNLGSGTPEMAAGWAAYLRERLAAPGRPKVTFELGNELWMKDDISHAQTDPATYVKRAKATMAAVRKVDPAARFYAIGLENYGRYRFNAHRGWNDTVLKGLAAEIEGLAIHNAYAPLLPGAETPSPAAVYRAMLAAPANIAANLATTQAQLEKAEGGRRLSLAITEWGPLFAVDPNNPFFDHVKTMGSGVFAARTLNAFLASPRVTEAEFFKLSDLLNSGWIGRKPATGYAATPALEVLRLYAKSLSGRLVGTAVSGPSFSGGPIGFVDRVEAAPTVEAAASLAEDGTLAILLSNASLDAPAEVEIALDRARAGEAEIVSGPAPDATRGTVMIDVPGLSFAPSAHFGTPRPRGADEIAIATKPVPAGRSVTLVLPPASVAALRLKAAP